MASGPNLLGLLDSDIKLVRGALSGAHELGFVVVGLFALNYQGLQGSLLTMINLGFSTAGLFFIAGFLYSRQHTTRLSAFGGIVGLNRPVDVDTARALTSTFIEAVIAPAIADEARPIAGITHLVEHLAFHELLDTDYERSGFVDVSRTVFHATGHAHEVAAFLEDGEGARQLAQGLPGPRIRFAHRGRAAQPARDRARGDRRRRRRARRGA